MRLGALGALLAIAGPGPAQEALPGRIELLAKSVHSKHAVVRGEALRLLAVFAPERADPLARAMVDERDPRAAGRALIALGELATPGAEVLLGRALETADDDPARRLPAAYALGLLPDAQPAPAIDRFLTRADGASYGRFRPTLTALVAGWTNAPHPQRRASLQRLLDDDANRDGALRAVVVRAAGRAGEVLDDDEFERRVTAEWPAVRLATLDTLAAADERPRSRLARVAEIARSDPEAAVRARALRLLVVARHESAADAVEAPPRGESPQVAAARALATLTLCGSLRRARLAESIVDQSDAATQVAMLAEWKGPLPGALAEVAYAIAATPARSPAERAIATHLLARAGDERALPLLRALLDEAADGRVLVGIVEDLVAAGAADELGERLRVDGAPSLEKLAPRVEALFRAGRPEALSLLTEAFGDERIGDGARAELLRAWRRAIIEPPVAEVLAALPPPLAELLR